MTSSNKINIYDKFHCIADQCSFTCCQEWRIGVDEETLDKWQGLSLKSAGSQKSSQSEISLCDCTQQEEAGYIIKLDKHKRCPFLNENKLCRIVMAYGEEHISETCRTFPRQINHFNERTEYSLDPGCPAVVDLLKEHTISFTDESYSEKASDQKEEFLLYKVREMILTLMENQNYTLPQRMMMTFYTLLDLLEQKQLTEEKIKESMEDKKLQPLADAIKKMRFNKGDTFFENNELFLDIVQNYRKQKLYTSYLEEIAQLAEEIEEDYDEVAMIRKLQCFERQFSAYEELIEKYLLVEIYANCLMPEMSLEDMVMGFEWIVLEYAVLKQAVFLKWIKQEEREIEYSSVRDYITVISRVTGYDQSDIREYMENSFESIIWEWGYLALVTGNSGI